MRINQDDILHQFFFAKFASKRSAYICFNPKNHVLEGTVPAS